MIYIVLDPAATKRWYTMEGSKCPKALAAIATVCSTGVLIALLVTVPRIYGDITALHDEIMHEMNLFRVN